MMAANPDRARWTPTEKDAWQAHDRVANERAILRGHLSRIAEAHHKNVDEHGGTYGECNECSWTWPCPTYVWATDLDRNDLIACWDPSDDDEVVAGDD